MWWQKKKPEDLDSAVSKIEHKVDQLIAERDALKEQLDRITRATTEQEFSLDFDVVKVFSIERNIHDNEQCTIIGFLLDGQTALQEWYLYCSPRRHKELVEQFEQFKLVRDIRVYNKETP